MTAPAISHAAAKAHPPVPSCENEQATSAPMPISAASALSALPDQAIRSTTARTGSPGRVEAMRQATLEVKAIAGTLTDIERVRIAAENRHRSSAQEGMGDSTAALIAAELAKVEHQAVLAMQRAVRKHPLGPFVKATVGIGEKQGARLIAAVEDPYWNALYDRPRRGPAELWAYCGFHVLHPGQRTGDTHVRSAGVDPSAVNGQISRDPQFAPAVDGTLSHPGHGALDAQNGNVGVGPSAVGDQGRCDTHHASVPSGTLSHPGQTGSETHFCPAGVGPSAVTGHSTGDAHGSSDRDGIPSCSHPGHELADDHRSRAGVAARRAKGQQANWSNEAKMRARLCAESCVKQLHKPCAVPEDGTWAIHGDGCTCSPYRLIYDTSKQADAGKGLTPLHVHNRALRKAAKALLKDMWRAARDWHQEGTS